MKNRIVCLFLLLSLLCLPVLGYAAFDFTAVTETTYQAGTSAWIYPVFGGDTMGTANAWLEKTVRAVVDQYVENGVTVYGSYFDCYTDGDLLSISFIGETDGVNTAYPSHVYFTCNMDLAAGVPVRFTDVFSAEDTAALLLDPETELVNAALSDTEEEVWDAQVEYLRAMDLQDLTEMLLNADLSAAANEWPEAYTLFMGGRQVVLSLPVPHAIGDYMFLCVTLP